MRANARRDTKPELRLRSRLHRAGLRYRVDYPILTATVRVRPDIVFVSRRLAIFVDGCYWHACPAHGTRPTSNTDYWRRKLAMNVARDRRTEAALFLDGWTVLRFWEHEDAAQAAEQIRKTLAP